MDIKDSQRVLDSVRRIVRALRLASRRAESRFGLSGAQLFVLQALKDGSPSTIGELGERTYTHQSSVSTVVTKLEGARLLSRSRSGADARRREVRITPKGRKILEKRLELGQSRLVSGIARLSDRERRLLAALLERLVEEAGFSGLPARMFFEERRR
jgi:DNA-binding MarR family transcriptional regulator